MSSITILNGFLILTLVFLLRKLIWCLRWLWCYYHGKEVPAPIATLPQRSGSRFERHVGQAKEEK